jgi:tRNA threonylcarbamoyladenosine modification (KEOPS) complex  Pcc1 subunit
LFLAKGQDLNEKVREQRESTLKGIFCEIKKLPNDNKSVLQEVLECEFQIACLSAQMGKDAYFDAKEVPFHNRTVREIRAYNSKENLTEEEKKRIKEYKEFRDSSRYEIEEVRRRRTENFKKLGEYGKKLTELRSKFEMDSSKQKEQLQNSIFQNQSQMNNSQSSVQKNVNSNIKSSQHSSQRSEYLQQIPDQLNSNVYHEMDSSKQKEQFNQQNSIFQHQPQNQMNNSQSSVQKNVDSNIKSSQHSSQRNEYLQQIPGQLNSNVYNVEVHSPKQKEQLQNSIFQNQSQMNNSQSLVKQKTQSLIQ